MKIYSNTFTQAFKLSLPVFFGYIAIGIPFGLMVIQAGYPWMLAPIMSILMYAGAGQYIAIGLFATNAPISSIALTILMVNIRHIVYGLSLIEAFEHVGKWKPYLIFSLTDETYALLTGVKTPPNVNQGYFFGTIALLNHGYWILGSCIGALAGELLPFSFEGIDFALTALFMVLLIEQLYRTKDFFPPLLGIGSAIFALYIIGPNNMLIAALTFALALLILIRGTQRGAKK